MLSNCSRPASLISQKSITFDHIYERKIQVYNYLRKQPSSWRRTIGGVLKSTCSPIANKTSTFDVVSLIICSSESRAGSVIAGTAPSFSIKKICANPALKWAKIITGCHITLQPKKLTHCTLKLSRVEPGQYLDGRPPEKTRLLLEEVLVRPAGGVHLAVCVVPNAPVQWRGHYTVKSTVLRMRC